MNRRQFVVSAAALPVLLQGTRAAESGPTVSLLDSLVRDGLVPGAAVLAARQGQTRLDHVVGTHCRVGERQAPLTAATVHPLYSFSKLITGTMVGLAKQEGKLDYGDPVRKHIPDFQGGGKDGITLRQCLTHAAGLTKPALQPVLEEAGWNDCLQTLCAARPEWEPGSRTAYHGWSGAFLAAECVRRVYGNQAWPDLVQEKLFRPLGALTLTYRLPESGADVAIVPQPDAAKPLPDSVRRAFSYAGHPGAGCLGTLADALKVVQLHVQQGKWNGADLLRQDVWREMHTVAFAAEIQAALAAGRKPAHEPWGLGPLLRGPDPAVGSHRWFGFYNQKSSSVFGHAGIDTFIGVGDPSRGLALVFATTHSPKTAEQTNTVRNQVTDLAFGELT